jgi:hypothetical protein
LQIQRPRKHKGRLQAVLCAKERKKKGKEKKVDNNTLAIILYLK